MLQGRPAARSNELFNRSFLECLALVVFYGFFPLWLLSYPKVHSSVSSITHGSHFLFYFDFLSPLSCLVLRSFSMKCEDEYVSLNTVK